MTTAGEAIARERKLAGLTQRGLANRITYSLSLVKAVEQGREPASPGMISAVARALRILPEQLTGAPYDDGKPMSDAVNGITALLAEGRYARAEEPLPLDAIEAKLNEARRLYRADRTRQTIEMLPGIIRQIHGAVQTMTGDAQRRAYSQLAWAYIFAEWAARRVGQTRLAIPALDLADHYAPKGDDPHYGDFSMLARARVLTHIGESGVAGQLIDTVIERAEADTTTTGLVMTGYSHLAACINEARKLNYANAVSHVDAAREYADRTGETDVYMTSFGPLNVEFHRHAIELESGDPHKAAREGTQLTIPSGYDKPTRIGHHWQDNARAWLMAGNPDKALVALNKARAVAPQQTRLHPSVRETLHGIAAAQRRRSESLVGFASWVGTSL
ncbi:helix-turn-helix domain-containing protein [Nocardia wallacei]|uniref:helix-turn-helix domain-containing protein n=1 Tax=Nocardia wallacei TaxID=480035 RepID=UPI002454A592|nr:helix-turn-helix transcriptional regulator [Nocardia wallacei]